jgi:hypothetical protein
MFSIVQVKPASPSFGRRNTFCIERSDKDIRGYPYLIVEKKQPLGLSFLPGLSDWKILFFALDGRLQMLDLNRFVEDFLKSDADELVRLGRSQIAHHALAQAARPLGGRYDQRVLAVDLFDQLVNGWI